MAAPVATIDHALTGRTRLRIKAMRGNTNYFAQLAEQLGGCEAVLRVSTSPRTAGILIEHQPAGLSAIAVAARRQGWFALPGNSNLHPPTVTPRIPMPDARLLLAGVFGGLAAVQALRGDIMAPALSMLWYAVTLLPTQDVP